MSGMIKLDATAYIMRYFDANYGIAQYHSDSVWVSGHAFLDGKYYTGKALADLFPEDKVLNHEMFSAKVKSLNGSFAIVAKRGDICFAAVDRVRSIPLFYAIKEGGFYISNSAKWVKENLGENSIDKLSFNEFYCAGYVTGKETLLSDVKQLEAAECLIYDAGKDKERLKTKRYYGYVSDDILAKPGQGLLDELDKALNGAFERLITSASGRTLVVPLSGGLDSRLLVSMLKRRGYSNAICFSYGRRNNRESRKSRDVANRLGFKWIFVEYSPSKWRKWRESEEFKRYFNFADNFASLPHIDDWAAVREIKNAKLIPENSIFVPGHTGDFISGGHLKYIFGPHGATDGRDLINDIVDKHYGLWPEKLKNKEIRLGICEKIRNSLPKGNNGPQDTASNYEYWEWQERQAKFIINSVRVYDFWGFGWRLPFWDSGIMDFWGRIPYGLKLNKRLYIEYLMTFDQYGLFGTANKKSARSKIMEGVMERRRGFFMRKVFSSYRAYKRLTEYVDGPKAAYGMYGFFTLLSNAAKIRNPNSLLVRDYLNNFMSVRSK